MSIPRLAEPCRSLSQARGTPLMLAGLWLFCVIAGWLAILWFASRPGSETGSPVRWPEATGLVRNPHGVTLVMFAHPKCPCSEASVDELRQIMETGPTGMTATVVFVRPAGTDEAWARTRLWDAAGEIPGVHRVVDDGGCEARRFQAGTAGRTLLYGADGELLFAGGITASRGHRGDNPGEAAIVALLHGQEAETRSTPAFGCPLFATHTP